MKKNLWLGLIAFLVVANTILWLSVNNTKDKNFVVTFYSVGQGDSALIRTPAGYNILVDGGPNNKISDYLNRDLPINDRDLDLVILTHPHSDHVFGLINVLKDFKVKKVLTSNSMNTSAEFNLWTDTIKNEGIELKYVKATESISFSDGVTFKFNWPDSEQPFKGDDLNEASVVFTLSYKDLDILMMGDADSQVQPYIGDISSVEVLKVPHHGAKTSMADSFINQLKPEIAVISVGEGNRYSHPRPETLDQLEKVGSKVLRTDKNGTVKIVSDGQRWYTQAEK